MLEYLLPENVWQPPKLTSEEITEYCKEVTLDGYIERDFLVVFKIEPYIDSILVHINTEKNNQVEYNERFIFHNGYAWTPEMEKLFEERCVNNPRCGYNFSKLDDIYKLYSKEYPDWKLKRYYTKAFRLLDHIYHCMRKYSAKEMLYKAGLDELAANIDKMDEINLLSVKPSDIYEGISIRTLRALNCRDGAQLLASSHIRKMIIELQQRFPDMFKVALNDAQCSYIYYLINGDLTVDEIGRLFRAKQQQLFPIWNESQYKAFLLSEKSKEEAKTIINELSRIDPIYRKYLSDDKFEYKLEELKTYLLVQREEYDKKIRRSNRRREYSWQERGKGFVVRYPQTINDFCREAVFMKNCLLTYVDALISGDTTILFVRKENDVNTPFITLEIYENKLMQAYHRFNTHCTEKEKAWIIEYCKRHDIGYDEWVR